VSNLLSPHILSTAEYCTLLYNTRVNRIKENNKRFKYQYWNFATFSKDLWLSLYNDFVLHSGYKT
jgi:hypothetical protein